MRGVIGCDVTCTQRVEIPRAHSAWANGNEPVAQYWGRLMRRSDMAGYVVNCHEFENMSRMIIRQHGI